MKPRLSGIKTVIGDIFSHITWACLFHRDIAPLLPL